MTTTVDIATRFRETLAKIESYVENSALYVREIEIFRNELKEERDLEIILDGANTEALERLRRAVQEFVDDQEVEKKYEDLSRLFADLQRLIEQNDQKLRNNEEIGQLFASVPAAKLEAVDGIPQRIRDIYAFLESKGRKGRNPHYTVYSAGLTSTFLEELPLDGTRLRGIHKSHDIGNSEFYVAPDFVTLLRFDVSAALGKTVRGEEGSDQPTAVLTIFAEEPQTGGGVLELYSLNRENADLAVAHAGRSAKDQHGTPWRYPDGSTGQLSRSSLSRMGCGQFGSKQVGAREQGAALEIAIPAEVVQRWLNEQDPPVIILGSTSYMRFDAWRNGHDQRSWAPTLRFQYE